MFSRSIPALTVLGLLISSFASADLLNRWEQEKQTPESTLTESLKETMRKRQVLFVGGYLNEGITGYFSDNESAVKESFGSHFLSSLPPSYKTVEENAVTLRTLIGKRYFKKNKTPFILVGHSKGGAESLYLALHYPEMILGGAIDKVVIIQGAVGGSPVADKLRNDSFASVLTQELNGLGALESTGMDQLFVDEMAALKQRLGSKVFEIISSRIFFVRGAQTKEEISPELLITHSYMAKHFEEGNDGLLLASDQIVPGIGTDLGVLSADHADLTVSGFLSNEDTEFRKSFTRALIGEIFEFKSVTAFD